MIILDLLTEYFGLSFEMIKKSNIRERAITFKLINKSIIREYALTLNIFQGAEADNFITTSFINIAFYSLFRMHFPQHTSMIENEE